MTGTTLKYLMAFLMVLDHIGYFLPPEIRIIFHVLTRCVAVFFGYMAVEGFVYTHDRKAYLTRVFGMAGLMFVGNMIVNQVVDNPAIAVHNNIFLTLGAGLVLLYVVSFVSQKNGIAKNVLLIAGSILVLAVGGMLTEGGIVVIPFMLLSYLFRTKPVARNISYLVLAILLFVMVYAPYPTVGETISMLAYNADFMFITVIPVLALYNGKRGKNTLFSKYFFYVFYPAHLWIIALVSAYL